MKRSINVLAKAVSTKPEFRERKIRLRKGRGSYNRKGKGKIHEDARDHQASGSLW